MTKTQTTPPITFVPFAMWRDQDVADKMRYSLQLALTAYYADQTDATEDENVAATDLALADYVSSTRATVTITAADLAGYLRTVRQS